MEVEATNRFDNMQAGIASYPRVLSFKMGFLNPMPINNSEASSIVKSARRLSWSSVWSTTEIILFHSMRTMMWKFSIYVTSWYANFCLDMMRPLSQQIAMYDQGQLWCQLRFPCTSQYTSSHILALPGKGSHFPLHNWHDHVSAKVVKEWFCRTVWNFHMYHKLCV